MLMMLTEGDGDTGSRAGLDVGALGLQVKT